MSPNLYKGQLIIFYVLLTRRAARSYERKRGKSLLPYKEKAGSDEQNCIIYYNVGIEVLQRLSVTAPSQRKLGISMEWPNPSP